MKWFSLTVLCATICLCSSASLAGDVQDERRKPALRVAVDPRVELLSVIFRLAGNPEYNRAAVPGYAEEVEKHFGPYREHEVVKLGRKLRATRGVSFDAVMSMAVHLADARTLGERVPFDPHPADLDRRWRTDEARAFLAAARGFVKETGFAGFIEKHQALYELTEKRVQAVLDEHAHLEWFDAFFGARPGASFTVVPALLNGPNCYGPRCRTADGTEVLYCVLGVWDVDGEGQPAFDRAMLDTVVHEFCHSYCNAVVDAHAEELRPAGEAIFPQVAPAMRRQAYGNWKTMMYESLVRACVVRYKMRHDGALAGWTEVQRNRSRGFAWLGGLSGLLAEYEKQREKYSTLDDFAPRIVAFFNEQAKEYAEKQPAPDADRPRVVSITPANGATDVAPGPAEIKVVFDRPMRDGSWSLVGGGPNFPEVTGKPSYDASGKVWRVAVRLKPDWTYRFWLNSERFNGFQSREGVALESMAVTFRTGKGT